MLGSALLFASAQVKAASERRLERQALRPTFADDFSAFAASASGLIGPRPVWRTTFIGGDRTLPNNREVQWYQDHGPDGPFKTDAQGLIIEAGPADGLRQGLTHRSGLITSQRIFAQRYGYFEIRARLSQGRGLWPAFWLLPSDGTWPPEIDVMEYLGHEPRTYYTAVHARPNGIALDEVTAIPSPDLSAGFHNFGVGWRPDRISYFLDEVTVHETQTPADMHKQMYLLANLAVGGAGSWPGPASAGQRGTMRIAWIKGWQFIDLA